jgi:SHS2 domain-containing protein
VTYRYLPHTADIKVAIEGRSFDELLADGVLITRELLAGEGPVVPREKRRLHVAGPDAQETFLAFLRELLFLHATAAFLPSTFLPDSVAETAVSGLLAGEPFDEERHEQQPEVKAVTRHGFVVEPRVDGWYAEVVFDV